MKMTLSFKDINDSKPESGDLCLCDAPNYTPDRFIVARYFEYHFFTHENNDITYYVEGFAVIKNKG